MSILIMSEVFAYSDARLANRLVLLALADAAGDSHRMCWESVDTIAAKARVSRRKAFDALAYLAEHGVVEDVPDEEKPAEALRYSSVVRRIMPVSSWIPEAEGAESASGGAKSAPPLRPAVLPVRGADSARGGAEFSPNPNNPIGDIEVLRTSGARALHEDEHHRPGARGWDAVQPLRRGGRKSKKQIAEEKAQAELELDPAYVVSQALAEEAPAARPSGRLPASDDDLAPPVRRSRQPRSKAPAERLADYFAREAKRVGHPVPGTNRAALTRNLRTWLAESAEYGAIVKMIDTYWAPDWRRSDNTEAWKDFQNQRGAIIQRLTKVTQASQSEANRYDESAW